MPKYCTATTATHNTSCAFARDRVFSALIHTEQERVGVGLMDNIVIWGFPFSSCEAAKDEILFCLNDSQSRTLFIATPMEIFSFPAVSGSIINSHEFSRRKLVSNELDDHLLMGRGPKGLGSFKSRISYCAFHLKYKIVKDMN